MKASEASEGGTGPPLPRDPLTAGHDGGSRRGTDRSSPQPSPSPLRVVLGAAAVPSCPGCATEGCVLPPWASPHPPSARASPRAPRTPTCPFPKASSGCFVSAAESQGQGRGDAGRGLGAGHPAPWGMLRWGASPRGAQGCRKRDGRGGPCTLGDAKAGYQPSGCPRMQSEGWERGTLHPGVC